MGHNDSLKAAIVGAGVAGLAAALACRKYKIEVTIIDRDPTSPGSMDPRHRVLVWNNGWQALARLLRDSPENAGSKASELAKRFVLPVVSFQHRTEDGTPLWTLPMADLPGGSRQTRLVALQDFRRFLREKTQMAKENRPPAELRAGKFVRFYDDGRRVGVEVEGEGSSVLEVDLLLGAGGKRSPVRKQLLGDAGTRDLGWTVHTDWSSHPQDLSSWGIQRRRDGGAEIVGFVGEDCWVDAVGIDRERVFWMAAFPRGTSTTEALENSKLPVPVQQLLAWHECSADSCFPLGDVRVPARSTRGGVGLVGDSMHGVTLILGQSVSLALEDAAVLDQCLQQADLHCATTIVGKRVRLRKALAAYGRRRSVRPSAFNAASHLMPKIAMSSLLPVELRNRLDPAMVPLSARLSADALLRFDPRRSV